MKTATRKTTTLLQSRTNGANADSDHFKKQLLATLKALYEGDFSIRLPADLTGLDGKVADTFNQVASQMERFGDNVPRLQNEVGRRGKITERMPIGDAV